MSIRAHVFVSGKVQEVWFRATTQSTAQALGVAGWVRNLRDGRVEAAFEGEEAHVEQMVAWCRHGPDAARVDHLEVVREPVEGLVGFQLRPTV